ncbi:MAG TPA: hypothetical protein VM687_02275 [Stenotrophomonas sp.]|nr:hypothetical protein [Stenotrophomonas sp.]
MPGLKLQVTNAGRAALVNAPNTGTNAVLVSHVGVATAPFTVSAALTTLPSELKRLATVGGTIAADDTIHVSVRDESTSAYDCYGFGLYLADGTLFAVYSQPELLLGKAAGAMMLLALDAVFADIDVQQITFGATNFIDPAATTELPGVVELATETEATEGTDKIRAITAWLLKKVLDARLGAAAPSNFVKSLLGLGTAALFRAALELKGAALKDEGANNGLDADKLDGQHGAWYREWANLTGVPSTAISWPTWDQVQLKPATFPPSPHPHPEYVAKSGDTMTGSLYAPAFWAKAANGMIVLRDSGSGAPAIDAVNANNSAFATMFFTATGYSFRGGVANFDAGVSTSGTVLGDAAGSGAVAAFQIGNDSALWDINVGNAAGLRGLGNPALGALYFGNGNQVYYGTSGSTPTISGNGVQNQHQTNVAGGGPHYQYWDSQHIAYYKRAGVYGFYWRKNNTGSPNGPGEVELMNLSDAGKLWTLSGYGWGSSRKLKDIIGASPYGLTEVEQMSVHLGRYKPAYNPDGRVRLFLDAEQLLEMMPETVDAEGVAFNGEQVPGVQFDQLLPVAFNAIKQLSHIVRDLQAEVAELRTIH